MSLIAILIALAIEQVQGPWLPRRSFAAFTSWVARVRTRLRHWPLDGPLGVVVVLAPPAFLVEIVHYALLRALWPLALVLDVAVLFYCLGPQPLTDEAQAFLDARQRGDLSASRRVAASVRGREVGMGAMAGGVVEGIVIQGERRLLAVLVWFAILGPFGAVLYRLAERLVASLDASSKVERQQDMGFDGASLRLFGMLDWLPARLTVLGYALTGNFDPVMESVRDGDWWGLSLDDTEAMLVAAGAAALGREATPPQVPEDVTADRIGVEAALTLVRRTLVLGVVLLALITLGYWAG